MEFEVSIAERRYDLMGTLLANTIRTGSPDSSPVDYAVATFRR